MPHLLITTNKHGLSVSAHNNAAAAAAELEHAAAEHGWPLHPDQSLDDFLDDDSHAFSAEDHELDLSSLYDHVLDPTLRLALITHDTRHGRDAYDLTIKAFIEDLTTDPPEVPEDVLQVRTEIMRALNANPDRSSPQFWSHLDAYWSA